MSDAKKDIQAKVAARVQEELASVPLVEKKGQKLPLDSSCSACAIPHR